MLVLLVRCYSVCSCFMFLLPMGRNFWLSIFRIHCICPVALTNSYSLLTASPRQDNAMLLSEIPSMEDVQRIAHRGLEIQQHEARSVVRVDVLAPGSICFLLAISL